MFHSRYRPLLSVFLALICLQGFSQSGTDPKEQDAFSHLKDGIESRNFRFHALSVTSMKGMTRQLTSEYFLQINKDSLSVFLPYYGRSFTTNYPPTDLSTEFNTTQFSYQSDTLKKGGWNILIVPKNQTNASQISMSISSGGYCTLRINSIYREPITYYGTITDYNSK
jgi:hypothetical protein